MHMQSKNSGNRKILMVVSHEYISQATREINKLNKNSQEGILLFALDEITQSKLSKLGLKQLFIKDYLKFSNSDRDEFNTAYAFIKKMENAQVSPEENLGSFIKYDGVSLFSLVEPSFLIFSLANIIRQFNIAEELIGKENPSQVVILANLKRLFEVYNPRLNHILAEALRRVSQSRGIPVVVIQRSAIFITDTLAVLSSPFLRILYACYLKLASWLSFAKRPSRGRNQKRILFFNHGVPHAFAISPVVQNLYNTFGDGVGIVQLGDIGRKVLDEQHCQYHYIKNVQSIINPLLLIPVILPIIQKIHYVGKLKFWQDFDYAGSKIGDILEKSFRYFCLNYSVTAVQGIMFYAKLFHYYKPALVIGVEDRGVLHRALFYVAQKNKISSLLMQVGLYGGNHPVYKFPFIADRVCVEGQVVKDMLVYLGQTKEKFVITGQPKYDLLLQKYQGFNRIAALRKYNFDPKKRQILFTSQNLQERSSNKGDGVPFEHAYFLSKEFEAVYSAFAQQEAFQLIVKPHPEESLTIHNRILSRLGTKNIVLMNKNFNVYELIAACDLLLTRNSTTGLEAIILDKPLVIINLNRQNDSIPYVSYGAAIGVSVKDEIIPSVKMALDEVQIKERLENGRKRFIADFSFRIDFRSSDRIAALIRMMSDS